MKCPDCNVEMNEVFRKNCIKRYKCTICQRVETSWTICERANKEAKSVIGLVVNAL